MASPEDIIKDLEQRLEKKEDECFELQASLATTTGETQFAVQNAQEKAAQEVKHLKNQLRMAQQDANVAHSHVDALKKQLSNLKGGSAPRVSVSPSRITRSGSRPQSSSSATSTSSNRSKRSKSSNPETKPTYNTPEIQPARSNSAQLLMQTTQPDVETFRLLSDVSRHSFSDFQLITHLVECIVQKSQERLWSTLYHAIAHSSTSAIRQVRSAVQGNNGATGTQRDLQFTTELTETQIQLYTTFDELLRHISLQVDNSHSTTGLQVLHLLSTENQDWISRLSVVWMEASIRLLPDRCKKTRRLRPSEASKLQQANEPNNTDTTGTNNIPWLSQALQLMNDSTPDSFDAEIVPTILNILDFLREADLDSERRLFSVSCVSFLRGVANRQTSLLHTQHANITSTPKYWHRSLSAVQTATIWLQELVVGESEIAIQNLLVQLLFQVYESLTDTDISFSSLVPDEWLILASALSHIARDEVVSVKRYSTHDLARQLLDDLQLSQDEFMKPGT